MSNLLNASGFRSAVLDMQLMNSEPKICLRVVYIGFTKLNLTLFYSQITALSNSETTLYQNVQNSENSQICKLFTFICKTLLSSL